jgi:peptidoglycan/xylan/chitin deacetylase (PgdA/CDA1 family)
MLSAEQIKALAQCGIEIGSHTRRHPQSLPDLAEEELLEEVWTSRSVLENIVAQPVRSFAYPHSRVSARAEAAVAGAGYQAACAGVGTRFTPYHLTRVPTSAGRGLGLETAIRWRRLKHSVASTTSPLSHVGRG